MRPIKKEKDHVKKKKKKKKEREKYKCGVMEEIQISWYFLLKKNF